MRTDTKADKPLLALEISESTDRSGSYYHVYAVPRVWSTERLCWELPSCWREETKPWANLTIACQGNNDRRAQGIGLWDVYYLTSQVKLVDAEYMHKTLSKVEKKLQTYAASDGEASSFGQYVLRVAKALGVSTMLFPSTYSDDWLRSSSLADGMATIDRWIRRWMEGGDRQTGAA